ncbi:hypothetical protein DPM13_16370 [Paracoccus mutanolyticus]|uniref:MFS transporter n=1 Tax=Paracoccus mutanolyticus TaxID=1499308 RepID=A0ABM6WTR7_9RHOB|nr:hypothetical protein DPM13_16370 [Paracoccus mutanolyticus]
MPDNLASGNDAMHGPAKGTPGMTSNRFSTRNLVLVAIGIALNLALGQAASFLNLPIFLDSVGP